MIEILVVEDEMDIRDILFFNLEASGYRVSWALSAEAALDMIRPETALILLDVMLPGMSGFQLAHKLREELNNHVPIIFLTARNSESDMMAGFSAGCDDYVSKPFVINELLARIKAVLRRSVQDNPVINKIDFKDLHVDLSALTATLDGEKLPLSRKEFDILATLLRTPDTYFTRASLIANIWKDSPYVLDRTVDVHIARLRSKLGRYHDLIRNRSGFGYYIDSSYEV